MNSRTGTIYFDGLCRACSAEINHYRKSPGSEHFIFLDITHPSFNPKTHGLDPQKVHRVMHVRDSSGQLHEGVDAFRTIWQQLPRYRFLVRLSDIKFFRLLMEFGYRLFIRVRPYLPRKSDECSESPYCEVSK